MSNKINNDKESDDCNICALCQWNKQAVDIFYCSNPKQTKKSLTECTEYNDSCNLFEEREERKNIYNI